MVGGEKISNGLTTKFRIRHALTTGFRPKMSLLILVISFIVSRVFYYFYIRIPFDASPLPYFWQYIDPLLLKNNLLQSIFYLHGQPPLFNLFLGIILKLFPDNYVLVFNLIYLATGLIFAITLFLVLKRIGVAEWLGALLTSIFIVAPPVVLYERWLFYTYPVAALLCFAVLFLNKFVSTQTLKDGMVFFSLLAVIVLTRGIFNIFWFVVFVLLLLFFIKHKRKTILYACGFPFIILCFVTLKNYYLFGHDNGYAYLWPNLAVRMVAHLPPDLKDSLLKQEKISRLMFEDMMLPISHYRKFMGEIPKTSIPVLDLERKSTGYTNTNHLGYIKLSTLYSNDAKYLMFNYPQIYLESLRRPLTRGYFLPSSEFIELTPNPGYQGINKANRYFNAIFCGQRRAGGVGFFLLVAFPALVIYGGFVLFKSLRSIPRDLPFVITVTFILINIGYVTLVTTLISFGDYNRYRFKIDAFYLMLFGLLLTDGLKRLLRSYKRIKDLFVAELRLSAISGAESDTILPR